jgi:hypothetical protein
MFSDSVNTRAIGRDGLAAGIKAVLGQRRVAECCAETAISTPRDRGVDLVGVEIIQDRLDVEPIARVRLSAAHTKLLVVCGYLRMKTLCTSIDQRADQISIAFGERDRGTASHVAGSRAPPLGSVD